VIELWLWQYTDEFGKRRVTRWRMSAEDAKKLKDAVRVEGSREVRSSLTSYFSPWRPPLPQDGTTYYECPWELFRLGQLQGLSDSEGRAALGAWAKRHGIAVKFEARTVSTGVLTCDVPCLVLRSA
jgi:hypothetical protein